MKRILGSIEHERVIDDLELKLVRLILENRELRNRVDALTTANMKLCHVLERGVDVARNAEAALAAQRFEIDHLRGAGVLDAKDQSRETD